MKNWTQLLQLTENNVQLVGTAQQSVETPIATSKISVQWLRAMVSVTWRISDRSVVRLAVKLTSNCSISPCKSIILYKRFCTYMNILELMMYYLYSYIIII